MPDAPLAGRNALVFGVERGHGRRAAVALAEAGADLAVMSLTEGTQAEFYANGVVNEFWALGRKGIALVSDGTPHSVKSAGAQATAELGPLGVLVYHAPHVLPRETFSFLRSDPAIVVLLDEGEDVAVARSLLDWTRELSGAGLRANAVLPSRLYTKAVGPALPEHTPPQPLDVGAAVVYLASDASAAVEGALVVAESGDS
jgi:NAD(P)-dependent dehydrogenase (short-subunit alcohol dehydrogenase family)